MVDAPRAGRRGREAASVAGSEVGMEESGGGGATVGEKLGLFLVGIRMRTRNCKLLPSEVNNCYEFSFGPRASTNC